MLLTAFIILAAALSHVLPAGEFVRRLDPATQREVVPGSYHRVPPTPVSPLDMLVSLPKGLVDAGRVIFLTSLAGRAFTVVDQTGALRYAQRHRVTPDAAPPTPAKDAPAHAGRPELVLGLLLAAFSVFGYGVVRLGWDFDQMSALFFVLGVGARLVGGLGLTGTAEGFVAGFRNVAFSGMLIGFARAIFVVFEQSHVVDMLVQGLAAPLARLPVALAALGMLGVHKALHLPVPSESGQAVRTMPLLVPLSDLIGLWRQGTVLAYQYAAGLGDLLTPTNGALMAMLAACGVPYDQWLRFAGRLYGLPLALGAVAVVLGV